MQSVANLTPSDIVNQISPSWRSPLNQISGKTADWICMKKQQHLGVKFVEKAL